MSNTSATALSLVRLPATRTLVPLEQAPRARAGARLEARIEELAATAKVIRYDEAPARLRARSERRTAEQDPRGARADERPGPLGPALREPAGAAYPGTSLPFLAQVLGQASGPHPDQPLSGHRDAPVLGSEAYRRAGGEPAHYGGEPALFRVAV